MTWSFWGASLKTDGGEAPKMQSAVNPRCGVNLLVKCRHVNVWLLAGRGSHRRFDFGLYGTIVIRDDGSCAYPYR